MLKKNECQLSAKEAELALIRSELSKEQLSNLILKIYLKYNLNFEDKIDEEGNIIKKETNEPGKNT